MPERRSVAAAWLAAAREARAGPREAALNRIRFYRGTKVVLVVSMGVDW